MPGTQEPDWLAASAASLHDVIDVLWTHATEKAHFQGRAAGRGMVVTSGTSLLLMIPQSHPAAVLLFEENLQYRLKGEQQGREAAIHNVRMLDSTHGLMDRKQILTTPARALAGASRSHWQQ